jgi:hypothetical protein
LVGHKPFAIAFAAALVALASPSIAQAPRNWDGLVQVKSKRLNLVYLQPGADFRAYTKVMIDPTEVAFTKDWRRNYNSTTSLSSRISESDVQKAVTEGVAAASDIFQQAWTKSGYQVVSAPGPDVLRVKTGVINISVSAPDVMTAGRSYTFASEAGYATLFVEARDSVTGALLGRAVDQKEIGDSTIGRRSSVSNRGDFRDQVERWADISVRGMAELKALSPITP